MNPLDPASIVVGIILSIIANLLTEPVQNLLTEQVQRRLNRSFKKRDVKTLLTLQKELNKVERFYSDRSIFYMKTLSTAFIIIALMGLGDAIWALSDPFTFSMWIVNRDFSGEHYDGIRATLGMLAVLCYTTNIYICLSYIKLTSKIVNFDKYKENVERKITSLSNG